jgi:hypothetical protein
MTAEENKNRIATISLKIPNFWPADPEAWFYHIESQFAARGITKSITKFHHCITGLTTDQCSSLVDILANHTNDTAYEDLKEMITKRLGDRRSKDLKRLLTPVNERLNKRPSLIVLEIQRLLGGQQAAAAHPELVRTIFLERLPASVKTTVAASQDTDIKILANIADRIYDAQPDMDSVSTISQLPHPPVISST